jgi:hypothetical protein
MAKSIRQKIIDDFETKLKLIKKVSGYNTNIGLNVFKVVKSIDPNKELPAVAMWPQVEENNPNYGNDVMEFVIRIEAISEYGTNNPSDVAEEMLADIRKGLAEPTSNAEQVVYSRGGIDDYPELEHEVVGAFAEFKIVYNTLKDNPYS